MITNGKSRRIAIVSVAAFAVTVGLVSAAGAASSRSSNLETASVAIPLAPGSSAVDEAIRARHAVHWSVRANGVATATSNCDGCSASALTMQVVYARYAGKVTANNVATAWSACSGCRSIALSFQLIVSRKGTSLTVANRALALNAACVSCHTTSAAIQVVTVSPRVRELSARALARIQSTLESQLASGSAPQASTFAAPAAGPNAVPETLPSELTAKTNQIQSIVASDLGSTSTTHNIQVRTS